MGEGEECGDSEKDAAMGFSRLKTGWFEKILQLEDTDDVDGGSHAADRDEQL